MGIWDKTLRFFGLREADPGAVTGTDLNEMLEALATPDKARADAYARAARYYDGEQGVKLNQRTKEFLEISGLPWSENFCESVVDILADRLHVHAFAHKAAEDDRNEDLQEWLTEYWQGDVAAELQGTVHTQTPMKGDGFVTVDWNAELGEPRGYWTDPATCTPIYGPSGELALIARVWHEAIPTPTNPTGQRIRRLNLHYPDRIEKWFTPTSGSGSVWSMHLDPGEAAWPTPWVRPDGTPRGVGVIHFRHKPKGSEYGRSCLRGAMPQQDYLNKQLVDLAMITDLQAWRQRWGTGISSETAKGLKNQPGELWASSNKDAKFGDFAADDPTGALSSIEASLQRFAARNKRPLHLLLTTGELPSGESLRVAEAPLIHDALDCHPTYGLGWSRYASLLAGLEADFGQSGITYEGEVLQAAWRNPATRNEQTEAETAEIKQRVGVSRRTTLEELGYDPDREADFTREEREEREREFDRGTGPGAGNPEEEGEGEGEEE